MVTAYAKSDQEIKRRIGIAKTAYKKMVRVLQSKSMTVNMVTTVEMLCLVHFVVLLRRMDY